MRRSLAFLTLLALLAPFAFVAPSTASTTSNQVPCSDPRGCPDLISDQSTMQPKLHTKTFKPNDCNVVEGSTKAGTRSVIRFTFTTPNVGAGDLIVGDPSQHPEWFEWGACHGHYHFKLYAEYRLWTPSEYAQWDAYRTANPGISADDALVNTGLTYVKAQKQGFCVIDVWPYMPSPGVPKYVVCDFQGISVGWSDEYSTSLDGQFVDVTGLPHGTYVLEEEVNAHQLYKEISYSNNRAAATVTI